MKTKKSTKTEKMVSLPFSERDLALGAYKSEEDEAYEEWEADNETSGYSDDFDELE